MVEERRPSPEEMLQRAAEEEARARRGKLKVFFGFAPGVGKTYAMLEAARARRREGLDVVVGWLETHGRAETAALAEGLERISPRSLGHRGVTLEELDLDAALARRPALILVDELPHSNAPGSRHPKRWNDVEELLQAGIDVYTTLNVQHVDSLNDVVGQITGISVRETVPDVVLDRASEIELVDLSPEDLLQRLKEGKVYVPAQAERAMRNFFQKGNLIALRELALRRAAERVDAQVEEWKREHGIAESWPTRDRLLVAVSPAPQADDVIRAAYRMAARLRAPWIALTVERPGFNLLPEATRERAAEHVELARRLGAETLVVAGERIAEEILEVARQRNVTRIVVGRPTHTRWRDRIFGSMLEELIRGAQGMEVVVSSGTEETPAEPLPPRPPRRRATPRQYWAALIGVLIAAIVCFATRPFFDLADRVMIHLLAVLVVAARLPRGPSLLAAVASVASLDFFFVEPFYTFAVNDVQHLVTFAVMLVVAILVSSQTVRIREQAATARQREHRAAALYAMSRDLGGETGLEPITRTTVRRLREVFDVDAELLLARSDGSLASAAFANEPVAARDREQAIARWAFDHREAAGYGTSTLSATEVVFMPLIGAAPVGVIGVALGRRKEPLSPAQMQLLETFVAQAALAVERARLTESAEASRLTAETERARSALLSAVSHDLRTPLASIVGSSETLLDETAALSAKDRRDLMETIHGEARRLSRLIGDLLELTRLESGALEVKKEWVAIEELVTSAVERMAPSLGGRTIETRLPERVIWVEADAVLLEEVLLNLIDNACKYGNAAGPIEIWAEEREGAVELAVADRGPGIPPGEEELIFEKFYRAGDRARVPGTGLGLTIARAIVAAHGGEIRAQRREGGGAVFRVQLPRGEIPEALIESAGDA